MARGYLFTVSEEKTSIPNINADGMALSGESWQAEWYEDLKTDFALESMLSNLGADFKKTTDGLYTAVFRPGVKENYFKARYEKFICLSHELTFTDFISSDLLEIKSAIEDSYGNAVIDEEYCFHTFDGWLREMEPGKTYWFGNVILMH